MRSLLPLVIIAVLSVPVAASGQDEVELRQMLDRANRSASMWKERAQILEKENKSLRDQLNRFVANPPAQLPAQPEAQAAVQPPAPPKRISVPIPLGTTVSLDQFGGPRRRLQIFTIDAVKVTIQVDNTGVRGVPLGTGQPELLFDPDTGDRVFLESPIKRDEGFGNNYIDIFIIKGQTKP